MHFRTAVLHISARRKVEQTIVVGKKNGIQNNGGRGYNAVRQFN
jgi:hypothetical protein